MTQFKECFRLMLGPALCFSATDLLRYGDVTFEMLASAFPETLSSYTEFSQRLKIEGKNLPAWDVPLVSSHFNLLKDSHWNISCLSCSCLQTCLRLKQERDWKNSEGGEHVSASGRRLLLPAGVAFQRSPRDSEPSSAEHCEHAPFQCGSVEILKNANK